ncbi:MAG TPA: IPT/TIG domain-containing protein [Pyrinomonadaceae bacterium]|nr:IPT/TIG domain-containing protein [Pyrinomonadaceae bacterium]
MASPEEKPKSERKKMIAAAALGLVALVTLWYAFFSSPSKPATTPVQTGTANANRQLAPRSPNAAAGDTTAPTIRPAGLRDEAPLTPPLPIPLGDVAPPPVPEASRNIFAYYVPPPPAQKPSPQAPPPTPAPTPPLTIMSLSPSNVYARTSEFKLDVMGDKFTPQTRIYVDGRELETRYIGPQQLSATVPAAVIAYEGARQVSVRTPDGSLYSNTVAISVAAPPAPNYTYVGLVGGRQYNDTAILKDKGTKGLVNIQRGDTVAGRFRVTSISQREVVLVDSSLRIKHTLPLTTEGQTPGGPQRIQQPVISGDDDPNE